jgi:hypothetical protein
MANTSANTESLVCIIDCSGTTKNITPPHPVYGDLTGGTVTQLNMIQLGGENGLYS